MGFLQDLLGLRKGAQDFAARMRAVRTKIEQLRREREDILTAPACRADVKEFFASWIEGARDRYACQLRNYAKSITLSPQQLQSADVVKNYGGVCALPIHGGNTPSAMDTAIAALLGPMLQKSLFEAVDSIEWPGPEGLPMADRAHRITALDREIERLLAEEKELASVANELRLSIE